MWKSREKGRKTERRTVAEWRREERKETKVVSFPDVLPGEAFYSGSYISPHSHFQSLENSVEQWMRRSEIKTRWKSKDRVGGEVSYSKISYLEDKYALRNCPVSAKKLPRNIIKTGLPHSPGVLTVNICDIFHNTHLSILIHCNSGSTFTKFMKSSNTVSFPGQTLCIPGSTNHYSF